MKAKSAIQKGKRFEEMIAKDIESAGLGFARREIGSGSGKRKGDIFASIPFLIEAKNQKTLQWWKSIDQAKKQAEIGNKDKEKWALVVKDPRTSEANPRIYAVIDWWEFLKLLKKDSAPLVKKEDREMAWMLKRLITAAKAVLKYLEK